MARDAIISDLLATFAFSKKNEQLNRFHTPVWFSATWIDVFYHTNRFEMSIKVVVTWFLSESALSDKSSTRWTISTNLLLRLLADIKNRLIMLMVLQNFSHKEHCQSTFCQIRKTVQLRSRQIPLQRFQPGYQIHLVRSHKLEQA